MSLGILVHVRTNPSETGLHGSSIGIPQHRDKLIATVAAHKAGLGRHTPQLLGKRTDVFVALLVAEVVIDRMEIVKVEDAHRNGRLHGDRLLLSQDLLALVLVGQSRGFVEIDFALQLAVERGSTHRANKFDRKGRHQAHDVDDHQALEIVERRRLLLRVILCESRSIVANAKELLAHGDDVGALVADFAHAANLGAKLIIIICKLGHLCLILVVIEADEVEVITSVTQTVDV